MATMKAVQIHAFGDVDVLTYEDVERPEPQAGEVLVRVRAAGINPVDWVSREFPVPITTGAKDLPYILGWDISGVVVALGEGVTQFAVGDEVYGMPRFPGEAKAYSLQPSDMRGMPATSSLLSALSSVLPPSDELAIPYLGFIFDRHSAIDLVHLKDGL